MRRELEELKLKRHNRTTEHSRKWRNNAFYERKKYKALVEWVESQGLVCPPVSELLVGEVTSVPERENTFSGGV